MPDQVPRDVVQERYERLVAVVEDLALAENRRQVGRRLDVLVAEGAGRKDVSTARRSGRAPDNRLVHFAAEPEPEPGAEPVPAPAVRPGDVVTVEVSYAAPHHLVAGPPLAVRRTRAGDAWSARQAGSAEAAAPAQPPTLLGLPRVGALG